MNAIPPGKVSALLRDVVANQDGAQNELMHLVYAELRRIVGGVMNTQHGSAVLSATELVNEAYMRLFDQESLPDWISRKHFYRTAAHAMRYVVLHDAKSEQAGAKDGRVGHTDLPPALRIEKKDLATTMAIDDALGKLQGTREEAAEVFLLKHFAGRSHDEMAEILAISRATVRRQWKIALGFLDQELANADESRRSPPR